MTEKKKKVKRFKVNKKVTKTVHSEGRVHALPDRITSNLSIEPFNGCWVGFGYESNVRPNETVEEAKERVWDVVKETVYERSEELSTDPED